MAAAGTINVADLQSLITALITLANDIIPLLFALTVIIFISGIIHYLRVLDSEAERKNMRQFMIYGVIAVAVMLSVWSLAFFIKNTLFPSAACPAGANCGSTSQALTGTSASNSSSLSQVNDQVGSAP